MKFFSKATFKEIIQGFHEGIKNYPLTLVFSFLATCVAYSLFSKTDFLFLIPHKSAFLERLSIVFTLCIPWSFGLTVRFQKFKNKASLSLQDIASSIITLFLILYLAYIHKNITETAEVYHWALGFIATHMYVACAFFPKDEKNQFYFWHSNILVFHRFIFAYVVAAITCLGILGLSHIFSFLIYDLDLKEKFHSFVFCSTFIFLHTWVFVSGCNFEYLSSSDEEDFQTFKYLKNILQYVSIPLITLYIGVLSLYLFKILFTWNLPKGQVSYYVTSLAAFGILFFLLSSRFATEKGSPIFQLYKKYFFFVFVPLLILLWIAVLRRFVDYGISPDRYLLLVLTLWLTGITMLFVSKPDVNLGAIPASLFVISTLLVLSPLSADRLPIYLMMRNVQSKLSQAQNDKDSELAQHLSTTVVEMMVMKGQKWVAEKLELSEEFRTGELGVNWRYKYSEHKKILGELKLPEIKNKYFNDSIRYLYCNEYSTLREMDANGVERFVLNMNIQGPRSTEQIMGKEIVKGVLVKENSVTFNFQPKSGLAPAVIEMKEIQEKLDACDAKKDLGFELDFENSSRKFKFYATNASGRIEDKKFTLNQLNGSLLIYAK